MPTQDNRINDTAAVFLGLLHQEPMIGSRLIEVAEKWIAPYFSITRSQVYRDLLKMEEAGLVRESGKGPRSSVKYSITAAGKRAFQAWANQPISLDSVRNSLAVRVAFSGLVEPKTIQDQIEELRKQHVQASLAIMQTIKEAKANGLDGDAKALDFALEYHQMAMRWLGTCVDRSVQNAARADVIKKATEPTTTTRAKKAAPAKS